VEQRKASRAATDARRMFTAWEPPAPGSAGPPRRRHMSSRPPFPCTCGPASSPLPATRAGRPARPSLLAPPRCPSTVAARARLQHTSAILATAARAGARPRDPHAVTPSQGLSSPGGRALPG
jgi:hypothetical protein